MTVTFADPDPSGLAELLGGLIEQNLQAHPSRRAFLQSSTVAIAAPDVRVAVSLHIAPGCVRVANGLDRAADLRIRAGSDRLLAIAACPLRWGVPDVASAEGRTILADLVRGRIRIDGLLRHPLRLVRLMRLLNVHEAPR